MNANEIEKEYLENSLKVVYNKLETAQKKLESTEDLRLHGLITENINRYSAEVRNLLSQLRNLNEEELIMR